LSRCFHGAGLPETVAEEAELSAAVLHGAVAEEVELDALFLEGLALQAGGAAPTGKEKIVLVAGIALQTAGVLHGADSNESGDS